MADNNIIQACLLTKMYEYLPVFCVMDIYAII